MSNESHNNPHTVNYALYLNGNLVPAQSVSITTTAEDIKMTISLAPSEYLFQLGMNDRVLVTLFYYDEFSDEPGWKLFAEGEISGMAMRRDATLKSISFNVTSLLHGALEYPIRTIFNNLSSILSENALLSPILKPLFMLTGFAAGGTGSNSASGNKNKVSSSLGSIIKCPFDYINSLFEFLLGSRFYQEIRERGENPSQEMSKYSANSFRNAFLNVYISKWMYSRNFVKKIVPSPEQRPSVYEKLMLISNVALISRQAGMDTDGPLIDVIRSALATFNCRIQPITLPPIVKLRRSRGIDISPPAPSTKYMKEGYGQEEKQPEQQEEYTIASVSSSYEGLSRLYYSPSNYNKYIAEFIVTDASIYKAIPRCNLLVSNYTTLVDIGTTYDRITRIYTSIDLSSGTNSQANNIVRAAFPPILIKQQFAQEMYSNLISEEEMFRGPKVGQVPSDPIWLYYAAAANRNNADLKLTYLQDDECTEILKSHVGQLGDGIKNILYLFRYSWNLYETYRSAVNTAVVSLKYINPYILVGFPAVYVDTELSRYNFVGNVTSITWNFTANGCSTTINLSNVQSIEDYLSSIALSKTFASTKFITPAPSPVPNLDMATQTEEAARYNYGLLLYDWNDDSIVNFSDFFTYNNEVDVIISSEEDNLLSNLNSHVLTKKDCPYISSFESYMSYISRDGTSLEEYVELSPLREDIEGKGMPPIKILNIKTDTSTDNKLKMFLSNTIFAADDWDSLLAAYLADVKNNNPVRG